MEAKTIQEIINTADCNAEVNFLGANGELRIMGWARKLIETAWDSRQKDIDEAEQIGMGKIIEWVEKHGYESRKCQCAICIKWQAFLKEHNKEGK